MLIITKERPVKNPVWQNKTPPELHEHEILSIGHLGHSYADFITAWKRKHDIDRANRWFEVRIIKEKTEEGVDNRRAWWTQPEFMDKIFWVFQAPVDMTVSGKRMFCYILEPFEAMRVALTGQEKKGVPVFDSQDPALYLPVECTQLAWTETSNGYSDHNREREHKILTAEEREEELKTKEEVEKIIESVVELTDDQADRIAGKLL